MKKSIQEDDNIKILKLKIAVKEKHIYICVVIIVNISHQNILKSFCVVSFNPALFETNLKEEFNKIEHLIYKYKLNEGTLLELSKNLYLKIYEKEKDIVESIENNKIENLLEIFLESMNISQNAKINMEYDIEKYKYRNYSKITTANNELVKFDTNFNSSHINKFFIKTKPVIDNKKGVVAEKLKLKNEILCTLIDEREIAKCIMKILFSDNTKEFYGKIIEINPKSNKYYEIVCIITPVIFTKFIVNNNQKLAIRKEG